MVNSHEDLASDAYHHFVALCGLALKRSVFKPAAAEMMDVTNGIRLAVFAP
jgi:hypothetical protein